MTTRGWIRHDLKTNKSKFEALASANEPALLVAELFTQTGSDNKDHDTGIFVEVKTADGGTLLASVYNADNSGSDSTEYNDHSGHTVPLVVGSPGAPRNVCKGFTVHMWITTHGHDTWKLDLAKVTLTFSDGNTLVAERTSFQLKNNGASTDFANPA